MFCLFILSYYRKNFNIIFASITEIVHFHSVIACTFSKKLVLSAFFWYIHIVKNSAKARKGKIYVA